MGYINEGKPRALLIDIPDGNFEVVAKAVRQLKAIIAFDSMRMKAAAMGYMGDEEIAKEIDAARRSD